MKIPELGPDPIPRNYGDVASEWTAGALTAIGLLGAFLSIVAMALTFAYQGLQYLRFGYWPPISATEFCAVHLGFTWCGMPTDWIGLHQFFQTLSPGGFCLLASILLTLIGAMAEGSK